MGPLNQWGLGALQMLFLCAPETDQFLGFAGAIVNSHERPKPLC